MRAPAWLMAAVLALAACRSTPEVRPEGAPPTLPEEDFTVVAQALTGCEVKLTGAVVAGDDPVVVEKAVWEFVVDGAVKSSGEKALGLAAAAGGRVAFSLEESLSYVKDAAELTAMDARGGSMLLALRGTLVVTAQVPAAGGQPASTRTVELLFARSKEVRTPRVPHLTLVEQSAGRFSESEVQSVFQLGVVNPNPFPVSLSGIDYTVTLAGKAVSTGTLGAGEKVTAASTGVFEVTATLNEDTHGKEAAKLVKGLVIPWTLEGTLRAALFREGLSTSGQIKLSPAR